MHRSLHMLLSASAIALGGTAAYAQDTAALTDQPAAEPVAADNVSDAEGDQAIVVAARKREETLKDVPVAATALSGVLIVMRCVWSERPAITR